MKKSLTARQEEVLQHIQNVIRERGYPPSIREIGKAMGISSKEGVSCHLNALEKKGYIRRESTHRGIKVLAGQKTGTESDQDTVRLPLVGRIAAGEPVLAEHNIEDWLPVPRSLVKSNLNSFLLRVKGQSMIGDHILDRDMIVVRPQQTAENGEVVVAVIDGEATVKRFYRGKDHIRLQPANPDYAPIIVKSDFQICGKVIGLLRFYP